MKEKEWNEWSGEAIITVTKIIINQCLSPSQ
jgi:hypothetical protein